MHPVHPTELGPQSAGMPEGSQGPSPPPPQGHTTHDLSTHPRRFDRVLLAMVPGNGVVGILPHKGLCLGN